MIRGTFSENNFVLPTNTPLADDDQSARIAADVVQASVNVKGSRRLSGAVMRPDGNMLHGSYMGVDASAAPAGVSGMFDSITSWISANTGTALAIGAAIFFLPGLMGSRRR